MNTRLWPKSSAEGPSTIAPKSESIELPTATPVFGSRLARSTLREAKDKRAKRVWGGGGWGVKSGRKEWFGEEGQQVEDKRLNKKLLSKIKLALYSDLN